MGQYLARAFWMDVNNGVVQGSYVNDVHNPTYEGNAVVIHNTNGFKIVNNYLEANGENIMLGASGPDTGQIPSNIVIQGNLVRKPPSGQLGQSYKNQLECKNCMKIEVWNNVFENSFASDFPTQEGAVFVITPRTSCGHYPRNTAQFLVYHDNISFHSLQGLSLMLVDDLIHCGFEGEALNRLAATMNPGHDVTFRNNLFFDISNKWRLHGESNVGMKLTGAAFGAGSGSNAIQPTSLGANIVFDHNSFIMNEPLALAGESDTGYYLAGNVFTTMENTQLTGNYIGRSIGGDGNPGSWALANSGNNGKHDTAAIFRDNCIESANTNPTFFDYSSAPATVVNATCPTSRGASATSLLLLEGAIRAGNRPAIYDIAQ